MGIVLGIDPSGMNTRGLYLGGTAGDVAGGFQIVIG